MTYSLHREAERDLASAFRFYREQGSDKVALRFLAEFERVAEFLDSNPRVGTPTSDDRRIYPLRSYPYSVIYKPIKTGIRILVVRHQRRASEFGRGRR